MTSNSAWFSQGVQKGSGLRIPYRMRSRSGSMGLRSGADAGDSHEFLDYRDYQAGDDLRHIDWNVLGRSDRLVVKRHQQEIMPHLDLIVDGTQSMDFGSKPESLWLVLGWLVGAGHQSGFQVRIWWLGKTVHVLHKEGLDPDRLSLDGRDEVPVVLPSLCMRMKPGGTRILISDLYWQQEPKSTLLALHARAASCGIVHLLTDEELNPTLQGDTELHDAETGIRERVLMSEAVLRDYRTALRAHGDAWHRSARRAGVGFAELNADQILRDLDVRPLMHAGMVEAAR